MRAFFYSAFPFRNGQNAIHPFCSQEQNERNVANENQRWRTAGRVLSIQTRPYRTYRRKKSGYNFGQNETLLLISFYQKYEAYFSDVSIFVTQCLLLPGLLHNVYSCQDRASRRAFSYAGNPNYSEHSVPTILILE